MLIAELSLKNIRKTFSQGEQRLEVLKDVNLEVNSGQLVALTGPSGSGKTTLLQAAGLLDSIDFGQLIISGSNLSSASEVIRTEFRRNNIGFIYQFHHLLPEFSALENIAMPLLIKGWDRNKAFLEARQLLEQIGLADKINYRPAELSGGQQQRIAVARAVIGKPAVLLADEPTGNLDSENALRIFDLLMHYVRAYKMACLLVTHNLELAGKSDRIISIKDGVC